MRKPDLLIAIVLLSILGLITAAFGLRDSKLDNLSFSGTTDAQGDRASRASIPDAALASNPNSELDVSEFIDQTPAASLGQQQRPAVSPEPTHPSVGGHEASQPSPAPSASVPSVSPAPVAKVLPPSPPPVSPPVPPPPSTSSYQPPQYRAEVHNTNFGERYAQDAYGQPASQNWIAVIHETVGSATSAVNHFQTPHPDDADQASYHALIAMDGSIIYLVPPDKRAYGAGNSVFEGPNGPETIKTNPNLPPSVNNFAYHVSLETPPDGRESKSANHSGYSEAQYQSLAWLLARTGIPNNRVTTHAAVDRSGTRRDPRSFEQARLLTMLARYR